MSRSLTFTATEKGLTQSTPIIGPISAFFDSTVNNEVEGRLTGSRSLCCGIVRYHSAQRVEIGVHHVAVIIIFQCYKIAPPGASQDMVSNSKTSIVQPIRYLHLF